MRPTPLLYWVALPASRPGWHYRQTINAMFSRRLLPGRYEAFAKLVSTDGERLTRLARVGAITVR